MRVEIKAEQRREWLGRRLACVYNKLFPSRRLRFLGVGAGLPCTNAKLREEREQTGAQVRVFRLQPVDGDCRAVAHALLDIQRNYTREISIEFGGAAGIFVPRFGEIAEGAARRDLGACGVGGRGAIERGTGEEAEGEVSAAAADCFHYDD